MSCKEKNIVTKRLEMIMRVVTTTNNINKIFSDKKLCDATKNYYVQQEILKNIAISNMGKQIVKSGIIKQPALIDVLRGEYITPISAQK